VHPEKAMKTKLLSHRFYGMSQGLVGCFCCLLLAVAGCRVSSSAMVSSPPPLIASPIGSVSNRLTDVEPPIQLASLELDVPAADVSAPLKLEDAIRLSLEQNPDLKAVRASKPVARAAFRVAEVYPWNPQFQAQVLPFSRDRLGNDGAVSQQYVLMQTFEFGGQQRFRKGAAAANWRQVNETVLQAELMNVAQTARLFFAAIYQRELRDTSQSLADLNEQLVGIMQRRQKAGQANRADVELTRLQSQSSHRQQRLAEANYQTSLMQLRNQLNLDAYAPLKLDRHWIHMRWQSLDELIFGSSKPLSKSDPLDGLPVEPYSYEVATMNRINDETTLRRLVADRPDVVAARAGVTMASENRRLANAMRRPNLLIGPMWQRDEASTQTLGFQGQVFLPVVNTGKPLVRQRMAQQRQLKIAATQLENRAVLEARAALQRYERARQLVEQSRGEIAFDLPGALAPFEDQFKAGQITLLQVFAARVAITQSRQSFLGLLNELSLAAADVIQATGLHPQQRVMDIEPLPEVLEEAPTP